MSSWCGHGELLRILLELLFYVMIDSVQMLGKLSVTGMDFEGISLEVPIKLCVVDIHADQDYCW
jgi:hypothetical protein